MIINVHSLVKLTQERNIFPGLWRQCAVAELKEAAIQHPATQCKPEGQLSREKSLKRKPKERWEAKRV